MPKKQETEKTECEYLPPENESETPMPLVRIETPLELMAGYFEDIARVCAISVEWAEKIVVDSGETRDQARRERQCIKSIQIQIDKKRLLALRPMDNWRDELVQVCNAIKARLQVAVDLYDKKGVEYNQECARKEAEQKAKALAAQRAEEVRIAAERRQREAEEEKLRAQEAEKIRRQKETALKDAKKAGDNATARVQAEEEAKAAAAKVEAARAERERAERERVAAEEREKDEAHKKMVNEMAQATAQGKQKGVKNIWIIEIVDEKKIPEQFKTYDPMKARKYCEAGVSQETDAEKIISGLRCYQVLKSSGR